ncbi:MAG: hypothetical protein M3N13_02360 [Candidatus Eremiobacteraeota bacterium]|nr:hypothetical protein [Candidatus Eremiobacteraeota bacterium]
MATHQEPDPAVIAAFVDYANKQRATADAMSKYRIENQTNLTLKQSAAMLDDITNTLIAAQNASGEAINHELGSVQGPLAAVATATTDLKDAIDSLQRTVATVGRALTFMQLAEDLASAVVPFDAQKIVTAVADANKAMNPQPDS